VFASQIFSGWELIIHQNEAARQRARKLVNTPEFAQAQRQRKKVEALFAELKNQTGLRRLRLRRLKFVLELFFLAAATQNIKRLVRFLNRAIAPVVVSSLEIRQSSVVLNQPETAAQS
jgi:Transposase DDE domain